MSAKPAKSPVSSTLRKSLGGLQSTVKAYAQIKLLVSKVPLDCFCFLLFLSLANVSLLRVCVPHQVNEEVTMMAFRSAKSVSLRCPLSGDNVAP